nr:hypothetical protein [Tanacetum cinerariifolium]
MIAILEKSEHNIDFHQIVDFIEASHIRYALTINPIVYVSHIRQFWSTARIETTNKETKILATVDGKPRTISESSIRRNLKLTMRKGLGEGSRTPTEPHHTPSPQEHHSSHHATSSPSHLTTTTELIPTATPTEILTLRQYSRRATRIAQSKALSTAADELASLLKDDNQGKAFLTITSLDAGQDRENINKTSALPYESTPRVTSLDADEGTQDLEISGLKARSKLLEDKDRETVEPSGDDAPIKGRSMEIREEVGVERSTKRGTVSVPPVAGVLTVDVPTISGLVSTVSAIFTTASVVTPYSRRPKGIPARDKGKEKLVESEEPKKKKLQEQIDAQGAKKIKTSEEVSEEDLKEMMQLVEEIIRLGGHTAVYQFFVDMLKQFDREDLQQLWVLVKETLSIRQASSDKEKELWVELKRLFEPDFEDQLWTHTQNLMHDPLDWKLYDTCGVHHVFTKDQEILCWLRGIIH